MKSVTRSAALLKFEKDILTEKDQREAIEYQKKTAVSCLFLLKVVATLHVSNDCQNIRHFEQVRF